MSNAIRYDSLLVRELARELHALLAGARLDGAGFDRERLRLTLAIRPLRRGGDAPPSLLWQLHPSSGHLTAAAEGVSAGRAQLPPGARVTAVAAPPDERLIRIDVDGSAAPPGAVRRIVIELVTNQWNAVAVSGDERIVAVLRERETRQRVLRAGAVYEPPRPTGRTGATAPLALQTWLAALGAVPPGERLAALPRFAAYASPQNAGWILGDADVSPATDALERAWNRYRRLVWDGVATPVLVRTDGGAQPYVAVQPGPDAERTDSLLAAFARAAEHAAAAPARPDAAEQALAAVAARLDALDRRVHRLQDEQNGAREEALRLRAHADLLLSSLQHVRRGEPTVELQDFAGGTVTIELDPALTPSANAARLYDTARRRDRAAARIPTLLEDAARERRRLDALAARIRTGVASEEELQRLASTRAASPRDAPPRLPYHTYRTTGGLEVRVGRGSRANDELTFRHSSPTDVWLHARDVAGAHVILRWTKGDENPPARDLTEAAVLAALHSRARTSGTVPVDWTRRKYVRKPRKAGPGLVLPDRVRTVFVEPDPALEERLRETDC